MNSERIGQKGHVVSFIDIRDIGTNTVRLLVTRLNPNYSYTIISRQKQQVRLCEGMFDENDVLHLLRQDAGSMSALSRCRWEHG